MIYQDAVAEDGETAISVPSETVNQRSPASDDRDIIMARIRETGQRAREALAAAFDGLPETDDPEDYTRDAAEAAKDWLDDLLAAIDAFICLD